MNSSDADKLKDHEKWGQNCDCKLWGALTSVARPCGHVQLIDGRTGTTVEISEARRFVEQLTNLINELEPPASPKESEVPNSSYQST